MDLNVGSRGNKQTIFSEQKNVGRIRAKVLVAILSAKTWVKVQNFQNPELLKFNLQDGYKNG